MLADVFVASAGGIASDALLIEMLKKWFARSAPTTHFESNLF